MAIQDHVVRIAGVSPADSGSLGRFHQPFPMIAAVCCPKVGADEIAVRADGTGLRTTS